MSQVGRKYTLWRSAYTASAYKDQMGVPHSAYQVQEEVVVTVTDVRKVPGTWSTDANAHEYTGWKGKSEDGREFRCCWDRYHDDSMTPTYYWWGEGSDTWCDAEQATNLHVAPYVTADGKRAIPANTKRCAEHDTFYYEWDEYGCFKCALYGLTQARKGKDVDAR